MTVSTELAHAELAWTGVENSFAPGFPALDVAHIVVSYRDAAAVVTTLADGVHVSLSRDPVTGIITATPIAMPPAPGTVIFDRLTPAHQATSFGELASFSASVHERLHDAAALRDGEIRRDIADLRDVVDYPRFYFSVDAVAQPGSGEVLARHVFAGEVAFPVDLAESQGRAETAAQAAAAFSIRKNDVEFATATFSPGAAVAVFAGDAVLFAPGDVLTVVAPAVRDDALADLTLTLAGSRQ